jgi:hypothetical protein
MKIKVTKKAHLTKINVNYLKHSLRSVTRNECVLPSFLVWEVLAGEVKQEN